MKYKATWYQNLLNSVADKRYKGGHHETIGAFKIVLLFLEAIGGPQNYVLFCNFRPDYIPGDISVLYNWRKKTFYALNQQINPSPIFTIEKQSGAGFYLVWNQSKTSGSL